MPFHFRFDVALARYVTAFTDQQVRFDVNTYMKLNYFRQDLQDYQDNFALISLYPVDPVDPVRK